MRYFRLEFLVIDMHLVMNRVHRDRPLTSRALKVRRIVLLAPLQSWFRGVIPRRARSHIHATVMDITIHLITFWTWLRIHFWVPSPQDNSNTDVWVTY